MDVLVSVVIPCYNQAQYLEETLKSIYNQTYSNWECIIINDGSLDNTEKIAQEWVDKDIRFKYVYKENGGLSSARNAGLNIATGDYIQFLDSDDYIEKTKFERSLQVLTLSKDKDVKVAVSNFRMFINNVNKSSVPYCQLNVELLNFESLLYQWEESFSIPIHCALFDSSLFKNFRYPEYLKCREDWVMWVSLFHKDCKAVFIDEPLALYRKNPKSMTSTKDMLPDLIKAYGYFKLYLTEEEYYNFSIVLISKYYRKNIVFKCKIRDITNSNTYQTGMLIKKILKTMRVLPLAKLLFPAILKFKKTE